MAAEPKPFETEGTNPELGRDQVVRKEPAKDFDERTRKVTPWLNEDGTQNTGLEDLPVNKDETATVEGKDPIETQTAGTGEPGVAERQGAKVDTANGNIKAPAKPRSPRKK